jgi:uncharacterized protein (TIGR02271 family)
MLNENDAREVIGSTAYSADGDKIGKVGQLFLDDETGRPEFVTVNTGLFGNNETFIPVGEANVEGDRLVLPFSKDKVKDAPNVNAESGHLDKPEERRLYEYYGMAYDKDGGEGFADSGREFAAGGQEFRGEGHDTSGPNTDEAMTRSEERVDVGTTSQEAGRARLRKYVTTEQETHTVPVRKEKAVLETEPVTDGNVGAATSGAPISEEEHEVVLNEEQVVVDKKVQPVERVKLGTETVTEEQTVTEDVRKEHIEAEGDVDSRR